MIKNRKKHILPWLLLCLLAFSACGKGGEGPEAQQEEEMEEGSITTVYALLHFFEEGGDTARLGADIQLGDEMLKLAHARGSITIEGDGYTLKGSAPCLIRLEDACAITLNNITLRAEKGGLGLLGAGSIAGSGLIIQAGGNAIEAKGAATVHGNGSISLASENGSGILCNGLTLQGGGALSIEAALFAVNSGRGDIALFENASVSCRAYGDNAVKTDGALTLQGGSRLSVENPGEHNAAKIGKLQAEESAVLELRGGENGVGLFIVEQREDVSLRGSCRPGEVRVEIGKGKVAFSE